MGSNLQELDDGLLLRILCHLTPLPDLFNTASTCKRLRQICRDSRMHLVVDSRSHIRNDSSSYPRTYPSLSMAVQHSRPGDVISLSRGVHKVSNLCICWPLVLQGRGHGPFETTLVGAKGTECVLHFCSSALVSNLSVQARRGSCVLHSRGNLRIDRCRLACVPEGRGYIYCCVVSIAADSEEQITYRIGGQGKRKREEQSHIRPGVLTLSDTVCSSTDANSVVHCRGTGSLRNVRMAIRKTKHGEEECSMWWTIDSSVPGGGPLPIMKDCMFGEDSGDVLRPMKRRKLEQQPMSE
eukprot:TRINITY_DN2947_c0_g2_i5.p2 TRINITY_DN2947_c0_g2~~TRINITY_DN2947_c0_g2_i5.p2  ORF type:complete len:333 (+),score=13.98 TRINITY_DN2947_c0_g2_i5:112-999(+)